MDAAKPTSAKQPCLFPLDDGRRCLECEACQAPRPTSDRCPRCGSLQPHETEAELAERIVLLSNVAVAARELLTHVLMPIDPTAEDIRRIVGLDAALAKAGL